MRLLSEWWAWIVVINFSLTWAAIRRKELSEQVDSNIFKAIKAYKTLEPKMTNKELKTITTIGLLNGAVKAEKDMEKHLTEMVVDLVLNTDTLDTIALRPKVAKIDATIDRDEKAMRILSSAMGLATKSLTKNEYFTEIKQILEEQKKKKRESYKNQDFNMDKLRAHILNHVRQMQKNISESVDTTLDYLQENNGLRMLKMYQKRNAKNDSRLDSDLDEKNLATNLIDVDVEVNNDTNSVNSDDEPRNNEQIEDSDESDFGGASAPGGLLGVIAGLSSEGGSDVGALVGAITGLVSQLFGPGGLDIETLLSTGTSLIAGLLAGNRNFGVVLGEYVGVAFDGLSGGGGAINNGKFIGGFLGTVVASLSADPEDDDKPPQPMIFLKSLLRGFMQAKNGQSDSEGESEELGGSAPEMNKSDSFGFIKQVVSSLVAGVTNLVLSGSFGAFSGSSQASGPILAGSSPPQQTWHR